MDWKLRIVLAGFLATTASVTLAQTPNPTSPPQVMPRADGVSTSLPTVQVPFVVAPDHAIPSLGYLDCPTEGSECATPKRGVLAGNPYDATNHLLPNAGSFRLYGWLNAGIIANQDDPTSKFHGPYNAVDRDELMFNQGYLVAERVLSNAEGIDFGFRGDLLYGFDFFLAQSSGFELRDNGSQRWNESQFYGLALPQVYGEFGNTNASVKVGRFYSVVGYEGVPSTGNFFYSHAYSYQFAGPFTHWGALGTVKRGNWTFDAGIVNGWNALDRESDQPNFLGRVRWADEENVLGVSFAIITGNEDTLTTSPLNRNRTRYSFIVDANPTNNLQYVFHHWLGLQDDGQFLPVGAGPVPAQRTSFGPSTGVTALWYGIDQYLYYRVSDKLKAGARFEWFRDEDGTRVGLNRPANPNKRPFATNFYSMTFGLNYSPFCNVVIRPETRFDVQGDGFPAFDDGRDREMFTYGLDVLISF